MFVFIGRKKHTFVDEETIDFLGEINTSLVISSSAGAN
jgi:hypothetical protein